MHYPIKWQSAGLILVVMLFLDAGVGISGQAPGKNKSTDISVRVFNSTSITVPPQSVGETPTILTFDSERWDTDDMHDALMDTSRLTARTAGKYLIFAQITLGGTMPGELSLLLNGATVLAYQSAAGHLGSEVPGGAPGANLGASLSVSTYYELQVGDYVEARAWLGGAGGVILRVEAASPEFGMVKVP